MPHLWPFEGFISGGFLGKMRQDYRSAYSGFLTRRNSHAFPGRVPETGTTKPLKESISQLRGLKG